MKHITFIILMSLALLTTACNTMQGLGQDIKQGGQKLENAAR